MFSSLKLISGAVILAILLGVSWYIHHLYKESKRVPALISTINILQEQKSQERNAAQKAIKDNDEIRKKLAAVSARSIELAKRLRHAYGSGLPSVSSSTPGDVGTSGDGSSPDSTDADVANLLGACQRDAIRLNAWIEYYRSVPKELTGPVSNTRP